MRQVLCLADRPWSVLPTRTQQLMTRMKDAEVLYLEPAHKHNPNTWKTPGRQLRTNLTAYTLPPTRRPDGGLLARRDAYRSLKFIQSTLARHGFREPVLWCASPAAAQFLDDFAYRGLVYDCAQDWPKYPESWESELTAAADVCFAASPDLVRHLTPCNSNITLLPFGCNYPMFAKDKLPKPAQLRGIPTPIFGYAGTLWSDLDLSPLIALADHCPNCSVVLIGRDKGCHLLPELLERKNAYYLGAVDPVDLPDFLGHFQVCVHLLRRSRLYDDVIPPRMFEYLSAGKPIVAMLRPDQIEHFPDVVYGAHHTQEFTQLCLRALEETGTYARDRRREYGKEAAWSNRAADVNRILESIGLF